MRRLTILITALTLMLLASCGRTSEPVSSSVAATATGRDGSSVAIGPEAGKITLVHFWATWCGPCRYELPSFVEFAKANEGPRLRWVAVANDPSFDVVDEHLRREGIAMETLLDPEGSSMRSWNIDAIPTTIVLDGKGNEVARFIGARDWNNVSQRDEVLNLAR